LTVSVQPHLGICEQTQLKDCILFAARRKIPEVAGGQMDWISLTGFVLRRSQCLWNLRAISTQIDCKLSVFRSAAQRKSLEFTSKNQLKLSVFCSAAQRKLLEFTRKPTQITVTLSCSAAK
jgi:hypothetical protein